MTSPKPDEDHQARLTRLREEAEAVARRLREDAASSEERGDGHHHPAEAATDADARERELQSQLRWERRQKQIRVAEEAIAAGTYGVCLDCGQPIPEGRLRAVPDAVRCTPCQTASARRR
jgi:RNA polymerase-binding transcription factor DksA